MREVRLHGGGVGCVGEVWLHGGGMGYVGEL